METPPPPERPQPEQSPSAPDPPPPPSGPQAPVASPEAPVYGGPVPPGGWEQPIAQAPAWHGRPLASWGSRLAAYLLDGLILLLPVVALVVIVVAVATGSDVAGWVTGVLSFLAYLVVAFLYAPTLMAREGAHNGQTWGKQMMGIRVIRDSGETMGFGPAAVREIVVKGFGVGVASSIIPFIPWFLDYFWPLWDDENRALHDMICSTHVVKA